MTQAQQAADVTQRDVTLSRCKPSRCKRLQVYHYWNPRRQGHALGNE